MQRSTLFNPVNGNSQLKSYLEELVQEVKLEQPDEYKKQVQIESRILLVDEVLLDNTLDR